MRCGRWLFDRQCTRFDDQVSVLSIQQAFSAIWRSVSGHSKYVEICTFSIIFAKPGLMADTLLVLAFASVRSLWLYLQAHQASNMICKVRSLKWRIMTSSLWEETITLSNEVFNDSESDVAVGIRKLGNRTRKSAQSNDTATRTAGS